MRDGHGRLFRWRLELRRPRPGVHDVLVELPRAAPGPPARRLVPVANSLRHVPVAPSRPGQLRGQAEGDHPGPRVETRRALLATVGRPRLGRLLVLGRYRVGGK